MSEIDWSKAPEGATHARDCGWPSPDWYKVSNGVLMVVSCGEPWEESEYSSLDKIPGVQERPSEAWTGTGIPPVGAVCEIQHESLGWTRCEIVAHKVMDSTGVAMAIAWIDANTLDQSQGIRFRPIRTQEQIEAEERERAINEIEEILRDARFEAEPGQAAPELARIYAEALHQLGYRKQGEQ